MKNFSKKIGIAVICMLTSLAMNAQFIDGGSATDYTMGNVGIGLTNPSDPFVVKGKFASYGAQNYMSVLYPNLTKKMFVLGGYEGSSYFLMQSVDGTYSINLSTHKDKYSYFQGKLVIGSNQNPGNYTFAVKGNVGFDGKLEADEIEVKQVTLADYVFAEGYNLRTLAEVENFIELNGHLPSVPSAEEVAEEGMNVGEFQNILLEKVEELTLYILEQNKINEQQAKEIEALKKQLNQ